MGELYKGFQPLISLMIADFEVFDNCQDVTSRFIFKEKTHLFDYPYNQIELVFVELPKFKKELGQLETIKDKWIYFLKHCLGQINPDIESRIRQLSIDKLENLAEAVLDFLNAEDLTAWLEANSQ